MRGILSYIRKQAFRFLSNVMLCTVCSDDYAILALYMRNAKYSGTTVNVEFGVLKYLSGGEVDLF